MKWSREAHPRSIKLDPSTAATSRKAVCNARLEQSDLLRSHRGRREELHSLLFASLASSAISLPRPPSEDAALVLLFSLVASGQIKLRRIDGWRKIAAVLSQHMTVAA